MKNIKRKQGMDKDKTEMSEAVSTANFSFLSRKHAEHILDVLVYLVSDSTFSL